MSEFYSEIPLDELKLGFTYPQVSTYADLPDYNSVPDRIYVVETTTGFMSAYPAGFYLSTQSGWSYLGNITPAYIKQAYESNPDTNNFSDYYKNEVDTLAAGQATAAAVQIQLSCQTSDVVGDIVVATSTDSTVVGLNGNDYDGLALGIIAAKPSSNLAMVQVIGVFSGYTSLSAGLPVFIGTDGKPTTSPPATGDLQVIGIALTSTTISVNFAPTKVTRS